MECYIDQLEKELTELRAENEHMENLLAIDIHTCGPNCQRDGCVNRRLREENEALRMRVKALGQQMKPTREQVEQWAKAVWSAGDMYIGPDTDSLTEFAALAFAAGQASKVPEGWKLVPVEPTEEMMREMTDQFMAINGDNRTAFESAYRAMIATAPSQETGE